jgi:hypothetical protein
MTLLVERRHHKCAGAAPFGSKQDQDRLFGVDDFGFKFGGCNWDDVHLDRGVLMCEWFRRCCKGKVL